MSSNNSQDVFALTSEEQKFITELLYLALFLGAAREFPYFLALDTACHVATSYVAAIGKLPSFDSEGFTKVITTIVFPYVNQALERIVANPDCAAIYQSWLIEHRLARSMKEGSIEKMVKELESEGISVSISGPFFMEP